MSAVNNGVKKPLERFHTKLYKELETIRFESEIDAESISGYSKRNLEIVAEIKDPIRTPNNSKEQYEIFRRTMKILLFCGQCLGLNSVLDFCQKDASKLRFKFCSWRFLYSSFICVAQAIATIMCFYNLVCHTVNINMLASVCFYGSTCLTTFLFIRVSMKWPGLVNEVAASGMDEYVDPQVQFKCNVVSIVLISLAFLEHILSLVVKMALVLDCNLEQEDVYRELSEMSFSWLFDLGVPYHIVIGVILQLLNVICTINWNFSDLFLIHMSLYLTSLLNKVNEKLVKAKVKNFSPSFWRSLRENYTQATHLVRAFDDVISTIVLSSFATNLFFICLQLFNVLANGIKIRKKEHLDEDCTNYNSGPFNGYEDAVYFCFSLAFIIARSLVVSLTAARVHSASLVAAPALYDVPASFYCEEIRRFIEQVHGDTVALSGLNFFYVTKQLVLSIAGTIITYELVLLQFIGEELIHS